MIQRYTARLANDPNDADAYHHRGHALSYLRRLDEAIADYTVAIRLRPDDGHLPFARARHSRLPETIRARDRRHGGRARSQPGPSAIRERLGPCCDARARELAIAPESTRDSRRALQLARRAVELTAGEAFTLNTLGIAEYRAGLYAESLATLGRSLEAGHGYTDAFNLFFVAMAHHRLGHCEKARDCHDRAVRWLEQQKRLSAVDATELAAFRAEAEAVLAGPSASCPPTSSRRRPKCHCGSDNVKTALPAGAPQGDAQGHAGISRRLAQRREPDVTCDDMPRERSDHGLQRIAFGPRSGRAARRGVSAAAGGAGSTRPRPSTPRDTPSSPRGSSTSSRRSNCIEGLKPTPEDRAGLSDNRGQSRRRPARRPAQRLGDYTLLRELGRGGMGIVYEAEHESLKNRVALKVMHPRFRADRAYLRRFQTEARSAAKLHHTNIVPVFDYGEQDGVCYYAMQCIDGVGLERVLEDVRRLRAAAGGETAAGDRSPATSDGDRRGCGPALRNRPRPVDRPVHRLRRRLPSTPYRRRNHGRQLSPAIATSGAAAGAIQARSGPIRRRRGARAAARSPANPIGLFPRGCPARAPRSPMRSTTPTVRGSIHRDIKPPNLLLDTRGNVWVTDFGLAKVVEGDDLSQSHDLVGTLRFMAPERFRGVTAPLGDVYSLGAALYELLTLKPAFAERDQARLIDQVTHEPPAPFRQHDRRIPRDLETMVLKALAKDPKNRFRSAAELRDELRRYLESRPIRSRRSGRWSGSGGGRAESWPGRGEHPRRLAGHGPAGRLRRGGVGLPRPAP